MKQMNYRFQEITQEEGLEYMGDPDLITINNYPGNPRILGGEIGFHKKLHRRLVIRYLNDPDESVFDMKRKGMPDREIAKKVGLNLKSIFYPIGKKLVEVNSVMNKIIEPEQRMEEI